MYTVTNMMSLEIQKQLGEGKDIIKHFIMWVAFFYLANSDFLDHWKISYIITPKIPILNCDIWYVFTPLKQTQTKATAHFC